MSLFTSKRERRLWLWTLAVMLAIYSTLSIASEIAAFLQNLGILDEVFILGMLMIAAAVVALALKTRPGGVEIGVGLGVAAAYMIALLRMGVTAERTHLMEYSVVAVLVYEALKERARNGGKVLQPALLALVITVFLGWLDEGIQWSLPNRVYDIRDVVFNTLAAVMAISASVLLAWVRRRWGRS
ncbi:MAG: VanZ family protein [Chloroflexi bacterium]|nr:MAG: VanZ family protein [Chloroflexota bacterium]MBL1195891.1 VanZ family protein [Chloroflexota bacterium]NOH13184.1 VanZ family protein [Chloroflexota bacterium]